MDYLLDPYVVQMPKPFESETHLIEYLSSLSEWCKIIDEPNDDKFWFSAPALEELWKSGQFPRYTLLREIFDKFDDDNLPIDAATASRACEKLNNPPYIDDQILQLCPEADNILPDGDKLSLIPDEIRRRLQPKVADALIQTFTKLAFIHQQYGISVYKDLFFATRALDSINDQIQIKAHCSHINTGDLYILDDTWKSVTDPIKYFDIEADWRVTTDAVKWAFQDLITRQEIDPSIHKLPLNSQWRVGKHFNESIIKNHFDNKETLIDIFHAVVKVLIRYWGIPEQDHNKHLRSKTISVTRISDGAFAWRTHVSNSPDRLRLHYWLIEDEHDDAPCFELSNVVFKSDLSIERN